MNTVSLEWRGCLKLVVPTQRFSKVGHLAAHKQVVLVHDLLFGQTVILKGGATASISTSIVVLERLRKQADMIVSSAYNKFTLDVKTGIFVCVFDKTSVSLVMLTE